MEELKEIKEILGDLNHEIINDWNGSEEFYKLHNEEMEKIKKLIEKIEEGQENIPLF